LINFQDILQISNSSGIFPLVTIAKDVTQLQYTFENLTPNTNYSFLLGVVGDLLGGNQNNSILQATLPLPSIIYRAFFFFFFSFSFFFFFSCFSFFFLTSFTFTNIRTNKLTVVWADVLDPTDVLLCILLRDFFVFVLLFFYFVFIF
jgi:hypothetical protein